MNPDRAGTFVLHRSTLHRTRVVRSRAIAPNALLAVTFAALAAAPALFAQVPPPPAPSASAAPAAPAAPSTPTSQQDLDQLLAPIALYPDAVIAQILMASTYPLEFVEAARWSKD